MLQNLPKLDLSQLGVENGYSKIIVVMEIGKNPSMYPGPSMPGQTTPSSDKVLVTIEGVTNSPLAVPEKGVTVKSTYEFLLEEDKTITDVQSSIGSNLGLNHLTQI